MATPISYYTTFYQADFAPSFKYLPCAKNVSDSEFLNLEYTCNILPPHISSFSFTSARFSRFSRFTVHKILTDLPTFYYSIHDQVICCTYICLLCLSLCLPLLPTYVTYIYAHIQIEILRLQSFVLVTAMALLPRGASGIFGQWKERHGRTRFVVERRLQIDFRQVYFVMPMKHASR